MKKIKKELETIVGILERKQFLDVYSKFDEWLSSIGFRSGCYEQGSYYNYHWSHYDKYIDSLYSVELYLHDTLKLSIRFMRDRNIHKMMFVGEMGSCSETYNISEMKELILIEVRKLRDEQLSKLSALASF